MSALGLPEAARADLEMLLEVEPKNAAALRELQIVRQQERQHDSESAPFFKRMFGRAGADAKALREASDTPNMTADIVRNASRMVEVSDDLLQKVSEEPRTGEEVGGGRKRARGQGARPPELEGPDKGSLAEEGSVAMGQWARSNDTKYLRCLIPIRVRFQCAEAGNLGGFWGALGDQRDTRRLRCVCHKRGRSRFL